MTTHVPNPAHGRELIFQAYTNKKEDKKLEKAIQAVRNLKIAPEYKTVLKQPGRSDGNFLYDSSKGTFETTTKAKNYSQPWKKNIQRNHFCHRIQALSQALLGNPAPANDVADVETYLLVKCGIDNKGVLGCAAVNEFINGKDEESWNVAKEGMKKTLEKLEDKNDRTFLSLEVKQKLQKHLEAEKTALKKLKGELSDLNKAFNKLKRLKFTNHVNIKKVEEIIKEYEDVIDVVNLNEDEKIALEALKSFKGVLEKKPDLKTVKGEAIDINLLKHKEVLTDIAPDGLKNFVTALDLLLTNNEHVEKIAQKQGEVDKLQADISTKRKEFFKAEEKEIEEPKAPKNKKKGIKPKKKGPQPKDPKTPPKRRNAFARFFASIGKGFSSFFKKIGEFFAKLFKRQSSK